MWVVEGLQHDGFALITKVHHALVDGISGVDLASVIMDTAPEPVPVGGAVVPFERHPAPSRAELLVRTAAETAKLPVSFAQYAAGTLLYPQRVSRTLGKDRHGRRVDGTRAAQSSAKRSVERAHRASPQL